MPFITLLSFIVLTYDEEANLPHCLDSLRRLDCAVFVVDSGSRDRTVEIARGFGATVVDHPYENYARQSNWALDHPPIATLRVMRLDADEWLTPELAAELASMEATMARLKYQMNLAHARVRGISAIRYVVFLRVLGLNTQRCRP